MKFRSGRSLPILRSSIPLFGSRSRSSISEAFRSDLEVDLRGTGLAKAPAPQRSAGTVARGVSRESGRR
eukprot:1710304-Alexandrium_andersonii.AAC.1